MTALVEPKSSHCGVVPRKSLVWRPCGEITRGVQEAQVPMYMCIALAGAGCCLVDHELAQLCICEAYARECSGLVVVLIGSLPLSSASGVFVDKRYR